MKTPAKKMDPNYNGEPGVQQSDFSQFKMKKGPVNMKTAGSVAKMAGVSPMKNKKEELRNLANANDFAKTTSKENQDAYKKAVESRLGKETNL